MQKIISLDLGGVNCYLLQKNGKFLLVDTGGHMFMDKEYTNRRELLLHKLQEEGVTKENLDWIILTHGDNDHVCNAAYLQKKFDCRIAMNENDLFLVNRPKWDCYKINSKYQSFILKVVFKMMNAKIEKLMQKVYGEYESFTIDQNLKQGDTLEQFGFEGKVYEVPGHTPGSICILDREGNLIAGDLFANNKKPSLAINAQDFSLLKQSGSKIMQENVRMVYPGHGAVYEIQ